LNLDMAISPNFDFKGPQIMQIPIELTLIENDTGPVNKRVDLSPDGKLIKTASADIYSAEAFRFPFDEWRNFGAALERMEPNMAICLGRMAPHLPDHGYLTTKDNLRELALPGRFARTQANIIYAPGLPAPVALDLDSKGMPASVSDEIAKRGGPLPSLCSICPGLADAAYIVRGSTSSGITIEATGERSPDNSHIYVALSDGAMAARFIDDLFDRAWIAGLAWIQIGAGGQLLKRSIIDVCTKDPARLVFEADATLGPGLRQEPRLVTVNDGAMLDCPRTLTVREVFDSMDLVSRALKKAGPTGRRQRKIWGAPRIAAMVSQGTPLDVAERTIREWAKGDLYPDAMIAWTSPQTGFSTVRDILADPWKFDGWICDHPIEPDYVANGKFYADSGVIFTHGHGGQTFRLHGDREALS
jgi:hypothetical protein